MNNPLQKNNAYFTLLMLFSVGLAGIAQWYFTISTQPNTGLFLYLIAAMLFSTFCFGRDPAKKLSLNNLQTRVKKSQLNLSIVLIFTISTLLNCAAFFFYQFEILRPQSTVFWILSLVLVIYALFEKLPKPLPNPDKENEPYTPLVIITLLIILIVGFILRYKGILTLPPGVAEDEGNPIKYAYAMIKARVFDPFMSTDWNFTTLFYLPVLIFIKLGFNSILALKIPGILWGVGTILLLFLLTKELFTTRIALITATLAAMSTTMNILSRWGGYYGSYGVFFVALTLLLLIKFIKTKNSLYLLFCALFVGLVNFVPYTHTMIIPVFITILIFQIFRSKNIFTTKYLIAFCLVLLFTTNLRAFALFSSENGRFFKRIENETLLQTEARENSTSTIIFSNLKATLLSFNFKGGFPDQRLGPAANQPYLDTLSGILLFLGFIFVLTKVNKPTYSILAGLVLSFIFFAVFSTSNIQVIKLNRFIMIIPFLYIFSALALSRIHDAIINFHTKAKYVLPIFYILIFSFAFIQNYNTFFSTYVTDKANIYNDRLGYTSKLLGNYILEYFPNIPVYFSQNAISRLSLQHILNGKIPSSYEEIASGQQPPEKKYVIIIDTAYHIEIKPRDVEAIVEEVKAHFPNGQWIDTPKTPTGDEIFLAYLVNGNTSNDTK